MTTYRVIAGDETFQHKFDGEPQLDLTFTNGEKVYRVTTRGHDEDADEPTIHAEPA